MGRDKAIGVLVFRGLVEFSGGPRQKHEPQELTTHLTVSPLRLRLLIVGRTSYGVKSKLYAMMPLVTVPDQNHPLEPRLKSEGPKTRPELMLLFG